MTAGGEVLAEVAEQLLPGFLDWADWGNTWRRPLKTGVALEWATLAAVVQSAQEAGWTYEVPLLSRHNGRLLFPLRNEIPTSHGAQPGNSAHLTNSLTLAERFVGALTPKIELSRGDERLSLFREGCPYHAIMTGVIYKERPDIMVIAGHSNNGFPRLKSSATNEIIQFSFNIDGIGTASGELNVRNSPVIPCRSRHPDGGCEFPARGLLECSVHKESGVAEKQTTNYRKLYSAEAVVLVTGNDLTSTGLPNAIVRLPGDHDTLLEDLHHVGLVAVAAFGMEA